MESVIRDVKHVSPPIDHMTRSFQMEESNYCHPKGAPHSINLGCALIAPCSDRSAFLFYPEINRNKETPLFLWGPRRGPSFSSKWKIVIVRPRKWASEPREKISTYAKLPKLPINIPLCLPFLWFRRKRKLPTETRGHFWKFCHPKSLVLGLFMGRFPAFYDWVLMTFSIRCSQNIFQESYFRMFMAFNAGIKKNNRDR